MTTAFDALQTAARLPHAALVTEIRALLADAGVQVPQRLLQPLPGGGSRADGWAETRAGTVATSCPRTKTAARVSCSLAPPGRGLG